MLGITTGLILAIVFQILFVALMVIIALYIPKSLLGRPAIAVLNWLPPFLGGPALRDWAAATAENITRKRLAGKRTAQTACQLAAELEEGATRAMLPLTEPGDLKRIVACPSTGQRRVGVTAPEVLAIAEHIRKSESQTEQKRIHDVAAENARIIASSVTNDMKPVPCALQDPNHVCCAFANRPLHCRPLLAISLARQTANPEVLAASIPDLRVGEVGLQRSVAEGVEAGLTRALKSAGLDAKVYELNSALARALEVPDAAERWAQGENVFQGANCLR